MIAPLVLLLTKDAGEKLHIYPDNPLIRVLVRNMINLVEAKECQT